MPHSDSRTRFRVALGLGLSLFGAYALGTACGGSTGSGGGAHEKLDSGSGTGSSGGSASGTGGSGLGGTGSGSNGSGSGSGSGSGTGTGSGSASCHHGQCGSGSGTGVVPINCPGYDGTLTMDLAYASPDTSGYSYQQGGYTCDCDGVGFPATGALVVRFTTPSFTSPPTSGLASIALVEFEGPPTPRSGALSLTPCDFTGGITGQPGFSGVFSGDVGPDVDFTIDYKNPQYLELQPDTTYYLNVNNTYNGQNECTSPAGVCDVKVTLTAQR